MNWSKKSFENIAKLSSRKYYPSKENKNLPCIELEHIEQGTGRINGCTNSKEQRSTKNYFEKGEVLYGKLRPYLRKYYLAEFDGVCSTEIWVLKGKKDIIINEYLFYLVQTEYFNTITNISTGSRMPRADWDYVRNVAFKIPSIPEQQKIAQILSTWDKAIELKEKLIEEKKKQKKGLMQKLLTGEVRLPGFDGEWEEVRLGDIGEIVTGTTPSTKMKEYYENGTYPWITPTDITENKYISESERYLTDKGLKVGRFLPAGSLLVTCIASIGKNAILITNGSCNQQINAILPSKNYSNEFLYYLISYQVNYIKSYAGNSATQIINKSTFESLEFLIPPLQEQKAIAQILSTADKEIELLNQELEQLKLQKKGLMQLLLTGIIRVKS